MRKRAQAQVITTVLIILLIVAAIVIVWQVIGATVREGSGRLTRATDCLSLDVQMDEESIKSGEQLRLDRGIGEGTIIGIRVSHNGRSYTGPNQDFDNLEVEGFEELDRGVGVAIRVPANGTIQIIKLIGESVDNAKPCDLDGNSAGNGLVITEQCAHNNCGECDTQPECEDSSFEGACAWNSGVCEFATCNSGNEGACLTPADCEGEGIWDDTGMCIPTP